MKADLRVNSKPVEMNAFVENLVAKVSVAVVSVLRGAEDMRQLDIKLVGDDVRVTVNDGGITLNPFTSEVIANTLRGLVSSLKGVADTSQVSISVVID